MDDPDKTWQLITAYAQDLQEMIKRREETLDRYRDPQDGLAHGHNLQPFDEAVVDFGMDIAELGESLSELVLNLVEWLDKGGPPPTAWKRSGRIAP